MKLGDRYILPLPPILLLHGNTLSPRDIGFKVEVNPLFRNLAFILSEQAKCLNLDYSDLKHRKETTALKLNRYMSKDMVKDKI